MAEDIVAMTAKALQNAKKRPAPAGTNTKETSEAKKKPKTDGPKFLHYVKKNKSAGGGDHVVGDTRTHNDTTYYFCDCPNHKNNIRWHTWPATECRTRLNWLKKQNKNAIAGNATDERATLDGFDSSEHSPPPTDADTPTVPALPLDDPKALLAHALTLQMDTVSKDTIADLLSSLE